MKNACAWLAVLLALLLPVQGAVVALMACPHEVANSDPEMLDGADHAAMADEEMVGDETIVVAANQVPQRLPHHHQPGGKCGLCAACCMGAVLASQGPAAVGVGLTATEAFPAAALPAALLQAEGLERPPRES